MFLSSVPTPKGSSRHTCRYPTTLPPPPAKLADTIRKVMAKLKSLMVPCGRWSKYHYIHAKWDYRTGRVLPDALHSITPHHMSECSTSLEDNILSWVKPGPVYVKNHTLDWKGLIERVWLKGFDWKGLIETHTVFVMINIIRQTYHTHKPCAVHSSITITLTYRTTR